MEEGVRSATIREIQEDDRMIEMWRGMPRDMLTLMWHVIGATGLVARLRRALRHRRGRDAIRRLLSSDASSDDHDHGSDHRSPHARDEQLATSTSSHDHEKAGPSMSSHHDEKEIVDPDQHEVPPAQEAHDDRHVSELVEATPLTEQASTSITIHDDVPLADI